MSDNIVYLKKPKRFTLEGAKALLSQIKALTESTVKNVEPIVKVIQGLPEGDEQIAESIKLQKLIDDWSDQIQRLGAVPKGLWLVDFDSGSGYFCWRYDEPDIGFFHGYDEGFSKRIPLQ